MTIDLSYFDRWVIAPYAICLFGSVLIGLVYIAVRIKRSGIKTEYIMYILFLELISILICGNFLASVMQQKTPREAGFTSLGGAAGMLLGVWLNKKNRDNGDLHYGITAHIQHSKAGLSVWRMLWRYPLYGTVCGQIPAEWADRSGGFHSGAADRDGRISAAVFFVFPMQK